MNIPIRPTWRARVARTSGRLRWPALPGLVALIAVLIVGPADVGGTGAGAVVTPARVAVANRARPIERPPALGRFAVDPFLLRRLDGTVDGGRAVHGPGGATADTSAVRLGPWLFQDIMGRPRREAPWALVLRDDEPMIVAAGVTMPPALAGFRFAPLVGGVDYSDPLGINLPLVWVRGYEEHHLTSHYRVGDFAARDGAPFARISPELIGGLERLSQRIGPVTIISGYRHPAYNRLQRVGGALFSRHQAGQAADVYSSTRTPFEVARAAVETFGCGVGIGLGPTSVHIDVRGALMTWTYAGAALSEAAFDLWATSVCRGSLPAGALYAAEVRWLATGDDRHELTALEGMELPEAMQAAPADSAAAADPETIVHRHGETIRSFTATAPADDGPGVVVVDLRQPGALFGGVEGRMRHVRGASPEATFLGARALLEWSAHPDRAGRYLVYALRLPARTVVGVLPLVGPITSPAAAPAPASAAAATPAPAATPPPAPWVIVLASTLERARAEQELARWSAALASAGVPVALQVDASAGATRYRVTAGRWPSRADAERARQTLAGLPAQAWVLQPGR